MGVATQHYNDKGDCFKGRKLAFTRAITPLRDEDDNIIPETEIFDKKERQLFWDKYKGKCRFIKNSLRSENKKLKKEVKSLKRMAEVADWPG